MSDYVDLLCPKCHRWLAETNDQARAVCRDCGWEIIVRNKQRRLTNPLSLSKIEAITQSV